MNNLNLYVALLSLFVFLTGCQNTTMPDNKPALTEAPVADKRTSLRQYHGIALHDDYLWLKDASYPTTHDTDILEYLKQENAWFEQQMEPRRAQVGALFTEMKGRMEDDESAVPWTEKGYTYRWRYAPGSQYKIWERKSVKVGEFVSILDEPKEAADSEFFSVGQAEVSPNGELLAWTVDDNGSERKRLIVDNLNTGERQEDGLENVYGSIVWSADNKAIFYTPSEEDAWRSERVMVHTLGSSPELDRQIFHNDDATLFLSLGLSQSEQYLFIVLEDHQTSEVRYLPVSDPESEPQLVAARRDNIQYSMDHGNGHFYILVNDEHVNFRIATAPESDPSPANWKTLLPPSDEVYYQSVTPFRGFIAVEEMSEALSRIRVHFHDGKEHYVEFPEQVYSSSLGNNPAYDTSILRIDYESMITPDTVFDYTPSTKGLELRKQQIIPSGYDKDRFVTERKWATARDGVKVPVSLVYHKDVKLDGKAPLYLEGYGAYGYGMPPYFSAMRLSLLERGVVYAIAHVRGGDEMGYQWYLDGKLEKRTNTFNDFVDVARYLVSEKYTAQGRIAISGGSAGGELIGAAVIQAPQLWGAAVLDVPFVDVLNTMLDASLPLTPPEWQEWGNPIESREAFELISSYSPYDNIEARDYPPMLVTGGLNDPRVTYWEPAKWTAKMRALKTDKNELLMKINMGAGHGGKSGRYHSIHEFAEQISFVLSHLNVED
jgi:oligopeptidase B